jgi:hypothetical protein
MSKTDQPASIGGKYYDPDSHQWMTPEQDKTPTNEGSDAPATNDED